MDYSVNYQYLRPKKAAQLKALHEAPFPCRETLNAAHIPNGTLLPLKRSEGGAYYWGQGGVVDQQGQFVEDSSLYYFYGGSYPCEEPAVQEGTAVYCGYFVRHWGDFLVQNVPRLWYALEHDDPSYRYVFLSREGDPSQIHGNFRELLSLLGIGDRVDILTQPTRYSEVIVPELSYKASFFVRDNYYSPLYKKTFDAISASIRPDETYPAPCKKLFLSRSQFGKSKSTEVGLDLLDDYFAKNGFTILYPEKTPLSHMIYLVQHAEVYASASGTLPHNTFFGPDGQKVLILERSPMNNEYQYDVNRIRSLQVTYIDANLAVYPVELAFGPFIFAYNERFHQFTQDNQYLPPDSKFLTQGHYKKLLQQYFHIYKDNLRYHWNMDDFRNRNCDIIYEGYTESLPYFDDYIKGRRPFLPHHYFSIHYFKQFLKRLLGKS